MGSGGASFFTDPCRGAGKVLDLSKLSFLFEKERVSVNIKQETVGQRLRAISDPGESAGNSGCHYDCNHPSSFCV